MFELSTAGQELVKKEMARYETVESAIIPALYVLQKENKGWVSGEAIGYLSRFMKIPESKINEVFQFYTMFNKRPVGRHHVQVCTNISCAVNGSREIADQIARELKVDFDQVTPDGKYTVSKVECLGSCGTAPMMQVNDKYYENLTPESVMNLLRNLKSE